MGGDVWGEEQYADAAMYVGSREKLAVLLRASRQQDLSDADVDRILKSYISEKEESEEAVEKRRVIVVGGDYFTQDEYDKVRTAEDNIFSKYAAKAKQEKTVAREEESEFDLYTETLAQIYAEQGYYEQAKSIYSKLILAYPEKSAYFATLIEKLNELN
jgi:tetratricopeptide (TPR) repeat protein